MSPHDLYEDAIRRNNVTVEQLRHIQNDILSRGQRSLDRRLKAVSAAISRDLETTQRILKSND